MDETEQYSPDNVSETTKLEAIETLCQGQPDAVYVLSGISEKTNPGTIEKTYKPGAFGDVDWKGHMSAGKARALAAAEISRAFPQAIVAVNSSTFNLDNPTAPTDAEVMSDYLKRLNVPPENIIQQDQSTTTFTELIELTKYITKYQWRHVVVVAGETQKPRAEEMFSQIATLKDPDGAWQDPEFRQSLDTLSGSDVNVVFVSAEDILPIRDPRYEKLITSARETETWQRREILDQKALDDLKNGRYWQN